MRIHCLICLLIVGGSAWAQEERAIDNFAGVGVRAMGMGGAFVGVADDYTATYWNPAGLAQIDRREVHVGLLRNSRENTSTFNGTSAGSELSNTRFGSLEVVYPYPVYRGSLVFSVGFKRIKDFDWSLRQTGLDAVDSLYVDHRFLRGRTIALFGCGRRRRFPVAFAGPWRSGGRWGRRGEQCVLLGRSKRPLHRASFLGHGHVLR